MNNTLTCLAIIILVLIADAICIKQTIEFRELVAGSTTAALLSIEGVAGGVLIASALTLLRKRFARQKKPTSRRPIAEAARA